MSGNGSPTRTGAAPARRRAPLEDARTRRRRLRESISHAAIALASERGLDGVTVDEIARASNVSRRTFFNYFPSKAAAVIPRSFPVADTALEEYLADRESPELVAISRFLWVNASAAAESSGGDFARLHTLLRTEPSIRPETHALLERLERYVAVLVTCHLEGRTSLPARMADASPPPLAAAAVAAAAVGTLRVAVERWQVGDSPEGLEARIREAFEAVIAACSTGDASRRATDADG